MKKIYQKLPFLIFFFTTIFSLHSCEPNEWYVYDQIREKPWVVNRISSSFSPFRIDDVLYFYSEGYLEIKDRYNYSIASGHWENNGNILYLTLNGKRIRAYSNKRGNYLILNCREEFSHNQYTIECVDGWRLGFYY